MCNASKKTIKRYKTHKILLKVNVYINYRLESQGWLLYIPLFHLQKRLYFLFPMIWLSGFLLNMPDQFFYSITFNSCNYMIGTLTQAHAYLVYSYYVVFHFALPALIMLVLYIHMGLVLYKGHEMQKSMVANASSEKNILLIAQKNIVFTCMILLALYCSCWLWNEINMILFITQTVNLSVMSHHLSSMVVVLNSCVNPFIYTMRYKEFQYHLRKLMPCASCHADEGVLTRRSTSNTSKKTSSTTKPALSTVDKTQDDLRIWTTRNIVNKQMNKLVFCNYLFMSVTKFLVYICLISGILHIAIVSTVWRLMDFVT